MYGRLRISKARLPLLDREHFETFVYYTGHQQDAVTREIEQASDHYVKLVGEGAGEIARQVKNDNLDVLIYPEDQAWMCPASCWEPCAWRRYSAWHRATPSPQATGTLITLSHALRMEPENPGEHYTEQLFFVKRHRDMLQQTSMLFRA